MHSKDNSLIILIIAYILSLIISLKRKIKFLPYSQWIDCIVLSITMKSIYSIINQFPIAILITIIWHNNTIGFFGLFAAPFEIFL